MAATVCVLLHLKMCVRECVCVVQYHHNNSSYSYNCYCYRYTELALDKELDRLIITIYLKTQNTRYG